MGSNGKRKGKGQQKKAGAQRPVANGASGDDPVEARDTDAPEAEAIGDAPPAPMHVAAPAEEQPELVPTSEGAPWGAPLYKLDLAWTKLEARLLVGVLYAELAALSLWVLLNDMTEASSGTGAALDPDSNTGKIAAFYNHFSLHSQTGITDGTVFRAIVGAALLGCIAWFTTKEKALRVRRWAVAGGIAAGVLVAPVWTGVGVAYLDNLKGWLQEGSTLTLMGGLRGVATRLTLWLALLGGSMATGAGRQIHIDLIYRQLPKRLRLPASLVNALAAALVCFAGVWGFVDHIAINSFGAKADDSAGAKVEQLTHEVLGELSLTRRQVFLDLRTLPRVLAGTRYDQWMTGKEWNAWVDDAGFESRYTKEQIASIRVPDDTPNHTPMVMSPEGVTTRGMLVNVLGLVFPFGLLAIGLRFVLRALLTASGHYSTDPEEAHKEEFASVLKKDDATQGGEV